MYHYGGIYADLDSVCLQPFDSLFEEHRYTSDVLLGHLEGVTVPSSSDGIQIRNKERGGLRLQASRQAVPNALMASKPRAKFWHGRGSRRGHVVARASHRLAPGRPAPGTLLEWLAQAVCDAGAVRMARQLLEWRSQVLAYLVLTPS